MALKTNYDRHPDSNWQLYTYQVDEFERLRKQAEESGIKVKSQAASSSSTVSRKSGLFARRPKSKQRPPDADAERRDDRDSETTQRELEALKFQLDEARREADSMRAECRRLAAVQMQPKIVAEWAYSISEVHICTDRPILGSGALGSVVAATWRHTSVALKKLHFMDDSETGLLAIGGPLSPQDRTAITNDFLRECELNARIRHPNIVTFLGIITDDSEQSTLRFLMMELMTSTLHHLVHFQPVSATSDGLILEALISVCKALHYLHWLRPPVLHLDVKPKNVLLDRAGVAKLADLGEARVVRSVAQATTRQHGSQAVFGVGTPNYMAPEMRIEAQEKTAKVDMFSFGVMVAECAARREPNPTPMLCFENGTYAVVSEQVRRAEDIVAINSSKYPRLHIVTIQLIRDNPEHRWDSAQTFTALSSIT